MVVARFALAKSFTPAPKPPNELDRDAEQLEVDEMFNQGEILSFVLYFANFWSASSDDDELPPNDPEYQQLETNTPEEEEDGEDLVDDEEEDEPLEKHQAAKEQAVKAKSAGKSKVSRLCTGRCRPLTRDSQTPALPRTVRTHTALMFMLTIYRRQCSRQILLQSSINLEPKSSEAELQGACSSTSF